MYVFFSRLFCPRKVTRHPPTIPATTFFRCLWSTSRLLGHPLSAPAKPHPILAAQEASQWVFPVPGVGWCVISSSVRSCVSCKRLAVSCSWSHRFGLFQCWQGLEDLLTKTLSHVLGLHGFGKLPHQVKRLAVAVSTTMIPARSPLATWYPSLRQCREKRIRSLGLVPQLRKELLPLLGAFSRL